jgi:hypothetical protein
MATTATKDDSRRLRDVVSDGLDDDSGTAWSLSHTSSRLIQAARDLDGTDLYPIGRSKMTTKYNQKLVSTAALPVNLPTHTRHSADPRPRQLPRSRCNSPTRKSVHRNHLYKLNRREETPPVLDGRFVIGSGRVVEE